MRIVEISGIKLEIDERTARTVEQYRVGDKVKVLVKSYGESYKIHPGVILGFSDFKNLPSIEIMYLESDAWNSDVFKFITINAANKDSEIAPFNELEARLDKDAIVEKIDRAITKMENELGELRSKRHYFIERFAKAFEQRQSATPRDPRHPTSATKG